MIRRGLIHGVGLVSPLGCDPDSFLRGMALPARKPASLSTAAFKPQKKLKSLLARRLDTTSAIALVAAQQAVQTTGAGLSVEPLRRGVVLGSRTAGFSVSVEFIRQVLTGGPELASPMLFTNTVLNAPAAHITMDLTIHGPGITCMNSAAAMETAMDLLDAGMVDWVMGGGVDVRDETDMSVRNAELHQGEGAYMLVLTPVSAAAAANPIPSPVLFQGFLREPVPWQILLENLLAETGLNAGRVTGHLTSFNTQSAYTGRPEAIMPTQMDMSGSLGRSGALFAGMAVYATLLCRADQGACVVIEEESDCASVAVFTPYQDSPEPVRSRISSG